MNLNEQKINGVGLLHVTDSMNAPLLKIIITRDENTVVPNSNDLIVYVDKNDAINQTNDLRQYVFELDYPLRFYNQVSDEFVFDYITKDNDIFLKAVVKRHIGVENDVPYILSEAVEEELECLPISLFEDDNYIYTNYGNAAIEIIYPKNNDLNKMYLSDAMFYVHKLKNDGEFCLDDIYFKDAFTKTEDKLNIEVDNACISCLTSKNNSFSLDDEGNLIVNTVSSNSGSLYNDESIVNLIYPVGSIYFTVNNVSPSVLFGGTWEQLKDKFLLCAGDTYTAGSTGGEASHTLTVNEMPSHNHGWRGVNDGASTSGQMGSYPFRIYQDKKYNWAGSTQYILNTGGGSAHNNMPPYLSVYVWKRIG